MKNRPIVRRGEGGGAARAFMDAVWGTVSPVGGPTRSLMQRFLLPLHSKAVAVVAAADRGAVLATGSRDQLR